MQSLSLPPIQRQMEVQLLRSLKDKTTPACGTEAAADSSAQPEQPPTGFPPEAETTVLSHPSLLASAGAGGGGQGTGLGAWQMLGAVALLQLQSLPVPGLVLRSTKHPREPGLEIRANISTPAASLTSPHPVFLLLLLSEFPGGRHPLGLGTASRPSSATALALGPALLWSSGCAEQTPRWQAGGHVAVGHAPLSSPPRAASALFSPGCSWAGQGHACPLHASTCHRCHRSPSTRPLCRRGAHSMAQTPMTGRDRTDVTRVDFDFASGFCIPSP